MMAGHFQPPPPAAVSRVLGRFDRAQLAGFIAVAIDLLDLADGDPDLEPEQDLDAAHDDGCGPIYQHGRRVWGAKDDDPGRIVPVYGPDQSLGPINLADVCRQELAPSV